MFRPLESLMVLTSIFDCNSWKNSDLSSIIHTIFSDEELMGISNTSDWELLLVWFFP